jgi:hypothetical protein
LLSCGPSQQFYNLPRRIDPHQVSSAEQCAWILRPAFSDRNIGQDRALHHHWICHAEDEGTGCDAFRLDVIECPAGGNAALSRREETDPLLDRVALELVLGFGDQAGPTIEILAGREAFL